MEPSGQIFNKRKRSRIFNNKKKKKESRKEIFDTIEIKMERLLNIDQKNHTR